MWLELLQVFFLFALGHICSIRVFNVFHSPSHSICCDCMWRVVTDLQTYNNELFHYCPYGKKTEAFLFSNNLSALGLPWQQFVLYEISLVRLIMNSKDLVEIIEHYLVLSIVIFFHLIHLQCCKSHLIDYLIVLIGICYIN